MKLTAEKLRQIVLDEAAKFGKMKDVEDVTADEKDADELADTVPAKKDYTCESVLVKRLKAIKLQEAKLRNEKLSIIAKLTK